MARQNLTDSGGGGGYPPPDDEGTNRTAPEDLQDAGPGAGDSDTASEPPDGTEENTSSTGSDSTAEATSPVLPDDLQSSDPANQTTSESQSSGAGSSTGNTVDVTPTNNGETSDPQPDPTGTQSSGSSNGSNNTSRQDRSSTPDTGVSGAGDDYYDPDGRGPNEDPGAESLREQRFINQNDNVDANDVRTVFGEDGSTVEYTARGAEAVFAANNDGLSPGDVEATRTDNGEWQIQLTEEGRERRLQAGYDRGPRGAGERISGEQGITDAGSPEDPLEGTGMEAGLGETPDRARDVEESIIADVDTASGRQQEGPVAGSDTTANLTRDKIEVTSEDGELQVDIARGKLSPEGAANIDDGGPDVPDQDLTKLERENTSGVTPDFATSAVNSTEQRIEEQLRDAGVDPSTVDVNAQIEDGEVQATTEQFGDSPIRIPTADEDTAIGRAFDATTDPIFESAGIDGQGVAGAAGDASGLGGQRIEDLLGDASDAYQGAISESLELGGENVEGVATSTLLGPVIGPGASSGLADVGIALADERTGVNVESSVDSYTEGVYQGSASIADVPGIALSVKEGTEFVGYSADQIASGNTDELVEQGEDRASILAAQGIDAAQENPLRVGGQLTGALAASTVTMGAAGAVSTRAGTASRWAIQPGEELAVAAGRGSRTALGAIRRSDAVDAGKSAARRAKSKSPDVEVTKDSDAGVLEIDPELRQRVAERATTDIDVPDIPSASQLSGRVRLSTARGKQEIGDAVNQAQFSVSRARDRGASVAEDSVDRARTAASNAAESAQRAPSVAARNVALKARRTRRRASSALAQTQFRLSQAGDRLSDAGQRFTSPGTDFSIDEAAREAGRQFELRKRRAELELSALGASTEERLRALSSGVPSPDDLSDTAFRARDRAGDALTDMRVGAEMAVRTQETPSVNVPSVSRPQPLRRLSDAAYRTRFRAKERYTNARVGAEMALRTAEEPDFPSLENPFGGLTDLTVRVGSGRSSGVEDGDSFVAEGFDTDEIFGSDGDGANAGAAGSGEAGTFEGDSEGTVGGGGGQQLVALRRFDDSESRAPEGEVRTQSPAEADRPNGITSVAAGAGAMGLTDPFENFDGAEAAGAGLNDFGAEGTEPFNSVSGMEDTATPVDSGVEVGPLLDEGEISVPGEVTDVAVDTETPVGFGAGIEPGFEFGTANEQETRVGETGLEARVEAGLEIGPRTELEFPDWDGQTEDESQFTNEVTATEFTNEWASPGEALFGGNLFD